MYRLLPTVVLVLLFTGCAPPPPPVELAQEPRVVLTQEYRIGVDDEVFISVWRNPELSVTVPVRPDGMISVPLIGDVEAGGQTPTDVASNIEGSLSYYIREPRVAVIVKELRSHEFLTRVRVTGAVKTPSSLPYRQGITVLDAVLASGGINEFADANNAKLYRKAEPGAEVYPILLGQILNEGQLETNYELQPGDVVTVPERLF